MRDVVDRLADLGVATEAIWLLGGGARSGVWAQIRADVCQRPVHVSRRPDTCPLGAAMLAAVAAGVMADLGACAERIVEGDRVVVQPAEPAVLDRGYRRYRELFAALQVVSGNSSGGL
jgi:xylulokinase